MTSKNIEGMKFGLLTAIRHDGKDKNNKSFWLCSCECGKSTRVRLNSLNSGNTKSCGCAKYEGIASYVETKKESAFGMYHARARNTWSKMIDRCTNEKNKDYQNYGGRGISVCERWFSLKEFVADMGDPPDGKTLDRWPNMNGNYEAGNCRWATPQEQARNTRRNVMVNFDGVTMCAAQAAKIIGMSPQTLYSRISKAKLDIDKRIFHLAS